jgi:hypothetical protein
MTLSKVTSNGITDSAVTTAKIANCAVAEADLASNAVTSAKITDGTIATGDLASSLDLSGKTVTLPQSATSVVDQNIALLGFKMAVNEGLTVFNLVDGIVDEFHDESGTDEGEGSNDLYCASNDNYVNQSSDVPYSAGFSISAITEPQTSTTHTNPTTNQGTFGTFTVPTGMTSIAIKAWGAGGGGNGNPGFSYAGKGGGGGFASGCLAVTGSQAVLVGVGEFGAGGDPGSHPGTPLGNGGGCRESGGHGAQGGGFTTVVAGFTAPQIDTQSSRYNYRSGSPEETTNTAPGITVLAAGGGGGGHSNESPNGGSGPGIEGGAGGGLTGQSGVNDSVTTSGSPVGPSNEGYGAGGGDQEQGGQGTDGNYVGGFLQGGQSGSEAGAGGGGYYGGGAGSGSGGVYGSGGGGSSYYGHPQVTSGATEGGAEAEGGGTTEPAYVSSTNEGGSAPRGNGEDGYLLITGTAPGSTTSTTIVSNAFTASSAPTTSRIVVFQENVATPTLNTDIIASISRDGGSNFTTATLSDSGYVTGSSGQRILTGTATVSGQPSGTSMRWKLALANNAVKIHGVSLQWK